VRTAAFWNAAPSAYLGLTGFRAFWLDEAAAMWLVEERRRVEEDVAEDAECPL